LAADRNRGLILQGTYRSLATQNSAAHSIATS
jgi:hypothetical protein